MSSHMKKLAKKQKEESSDSKVKQVESAIMKGKKAPLQTKMSLKKANHGMSVKPTSPKPVVKKSTEKPTNIYSRNPATGKEEQMVMKAGKYAFATKKKGGSTKSLPKAMYGKSVMKKGGSTKKK